MRLLYGGFFGLAIFMATTIAQAQLTWDTTEQHVELSLKQEYIVSEFTFTNSGNYPLTIRSIQPVTNSIKALLKNSARTIEPGESGVIQMRWRCQTLFDKQLFTAILRTDSRDSGMTELKMYVVPVGWKNMTLEQKSTLKSEELWFKSQPVPVTVVPNQLLWVPGEPKNAKSIVITVTGDEPIQIDNPALESNPNSYFQVDWHIEEEGRRYRMAVTPVNDVENRGQESWLLNTDMSDVLIKRQWIEGALRVHAQVIPAAGAIPEHLRQ